MPVPGGSIPQIAEDEALDGLTSLIEDGFTTAVRDLWDFGTDLPGFVAREGPESPPAAAIKPILRLACRKYARGDGPQNLPGFDVAWGGICEPYLEGIGENPIPGSLAPPFKGGQCCGVTYQLTWTFRNPNTGELQDSVQQFSNVQIVGVAPERSNQPAQPTKSGGVRVRRCDNGEIQDIYLGTTFEGANLDQSISNVSIVGGAPDNCGNVPPLYDPPKVRPGLPTLPPSTPVDFPGIGPIGVDVTFDPDGTVNINLPDIGVEVGIEDPFGLGGDGGGASGPPPGDVGQPGEPVGVGSGGDEEGVAPEGSVLVGLRVQVVTVPNRRNRYTDEVLRGAYYVYMGVPGLLDHDPAGAMVRADQFIFAEQPNLTAWRIRANTGYELITTPYYRQVGE